MAGCCSPVVYASPSQSEPSLATKQATLMAGTDSVSLAGTYIFILWNAAKHEFSLNNGGSKAQQLGELCVGLRAVTRDVTALIGFACASIRPFLFQSSWGSTSTLRYATMADHTLSSREEFANQAVNLRLELKVWEKDFASSHDGKKAGREDIKQNPDIGKSRPLWNLSLYAILYWK